MNRRLIVMRHAKSSWSDSSLSDHERPLNDRGRREAPEVARRLIELDWVPEIIVSSDATRTRETWKRMKPVFADADHTPPFHKTAELYLAGMDEAADALGELDDATRSVLLLGHNPGWEEVVAYLSGVSVTMTTANAVLLEGSGETWQDALERGSWKIIEVIRPREL